MRPLLSSAADVRPHHYRFERVAQDHSPLVRTPRLCAWRLFLAWLLS